MSTVDILTFPLDSSSTAISIALFRFAPAIIVCASHGKASTLVVVFLISFPTSPSESDELPTNHAQGLSRSASASRTRRVMRQYGIASSGQRQECALRAWVSYGLRAIKNGLSQDGVYFIYEAHARQVALLEPGEFDIRSSLLIYKLS